ncbi:MAG: ornithine cyclodeaminase family protein [Bacteroidota bacterium]
MRQVSFEEIKEIIKVEDLFEPMRRSFIDYNSPNLIGIPASLLHFSGDADVHIKTAAIEGYDYFSIKVASMFPDNIEHNLSPYSGAVFLFDATTGVPQAVLNDRGLLTDLRTAAAGAVITDFVASSEANKVSIIGTGLQAWHQVLALDKIRRIEELVIYGRNQGKANALKGKFQKELPGISIKVASSAEEAVKETEIILTTTSSKKPIVKGEWLQPGQHLTAVGADDTFKHEIDVACLEKADAIFLDSLQLNLQFGEFSHAMLKNPDLMEKTMEFGQAFQHDAWSGNKDKITVAKLVGVGVQDLAAATYVLDRIITQE